MKKYFPFIFTFLLFGHLQSFSQTSGLDATKIAETYSNSIVKILLFDSLAEKLKPGSGYIGRGSGFIVTETGVIFTNRHVINFCVNGYVSYDYYNIDSKETNTYFETYSDRTIHDLSVTKVNKTGKPVPIIQVYSGKNNEYKLYRAKVLLVDTASFDGAILQIVSDINGNAVNEKFHPVPIGNSDSTKQGEDLCIYGFPVQFAGNFELMLSDLSTLTFGKHSGFDYVFNYDYGYIKTDASINGGNSGGPIFNSSNKVIGIATATGNKTGIGLIGGINAMYMLTSLDTGLLNKLSKNGLVKPQRFPVINSAFKPIPIKILSGDQMISKFNKDKKASRQFLRGRLTFKLYYAIVQNDVLTMNAVSPMPFSEPVVTFNPEKQYGIETDKQFVLWRPNKDLALSLDWTILGLTFIDMKPLGNIFVDSLSNPPTSTQQIGTFHTKPGLSFSFLTAKRLFIDVSVKPDIYANVGNDGFISYNFQNSQGTGYFRVGNEVSNNQTPIHFRNQIGINFTYNHFALGIEYRFGKSQSSFNYESDFVNFSGASPPFYRIDYVAGSLNTNSVFLTLGYSFYKSTLKKLPSQ